MSRQLARVVASGATFSAPFAYLTERSVFLRGRLELDFGAEVELRIGGPVVNASVAFVAINPPGVVLVFDRSESLKAEAEAVEDETWRDEDVTGTHEGGEAALLARLMARAEAQSETSESADPEDPTNTGSQAMDESGLDTGAADARAAVQQAAGAPNGDSQTRLRATTYVVPAEDD